MKRCRQGDDLISELPDCVLVYIVSLLSIKDAIKTSLFSRRWRSIFTHKMELDINSAAVGISNEGLSFVKYEERLVRRVDQLITQFISIISLNVNLSLTEKHSSHIDEWIEFAAESGVKKLELGFIHQYAFPYWLLSKSRLEYLHLKGCLVNPPSDFRGFRHLKTLLLKDAHLDKDFVTNLCLTCPQLEHLTLRQCIVDSICLKITGPASLRHLSVLQCQWPLIMFEVCSMDLITFEFIENEKNQELSLGEFPKLKKLFVCQCSHRVLSIQSMFRKFPNVQILGLCLSEKQVMKFPESFAILRNLKQLNLFIRSKSCKMELYRVLSLAKASPLLQKLAVTFYESKWMHEDERSDIGGQHTTVGNHHQLKEFELHGCVGLLYEIEFVIHVLRMAANLEKVVIGPPKGTYVGDGDWFDLFDDPSSYQSHKKWIEDMLQDYVPPNLQFVML